MVDPKDLVGIIQSLISWGCFFIALAIFKKFVTYGLSVAFVELLKLQDDEGRKKMARWFANGEVVIAYLQQSREQEVQDQEERRVA